MTNQVAFPGLGIVEGFDLSNVAFCIGEKFCVYWYGVIITSGIILAFLYAVMRGKYEKVTFDNIVDVGIVTVILGVVGARLYYVLTSLETYIPEPFDFFQFIKNIFNLRNGGLAIYGGIICGALAIILVTALKKINTLKFMDMVAPGVMIGQLMGRWGNFFNGEAYGSIVSEGHPLYFLRMGLVSSNTVSDFGTNEMVYVHPTFLYESLWNLVGFIIINALYKKKKFNGQIACMYLAWYGFGRFFIEGLRMDSLYVPGTSIRISQMVGIICFVVFGGLLIAGLLYSRSFKDESKLNGFAKILVPDLVMNPVFFEKKSKSAKADAKAEEKTAEKAIENTSENPDGAAEEAIPQDEEGKEEVETEENETVIEENTEENTEENQENNKDGTDN